MKSFADKTEPAGQLQAAANQHAQKEGTNAAASRIVDRRPEAAQVAGVQLVANTSPQAEKAAQQQAMIDSSPRMVAQRQRMERMFGDTAQLAGKPEEELQLKAGQGLLQLKGVEEEEPIQSKFGSVQKMANNTGLPDSVKTGVENLSGVSLDNVNVHFNSGNPAQLNALAYTQGTDIHVGPGQEKHLPHEAWHVVQQNQGRVKPTVQMSGKRVNDDALLEHEADVMGKKAVQGFSWGGLKGTDRYSIQRVVTQRLPAPFPISNIEGFLAACRSVGLTLDDRGSDVYVWAAGGDVAGRHIHLKFDFGPKEQVEPPYTISLIYPKDVGAQRPHLENRDSDDWAAEVGHMGVETRTSVELLKKVVEKNGVGY